MKKGVLLMKHRVDEMENKCT